MAKAESPSPNVAERLRQHREAAGESFLKETEQPHVNIQGPFHDTARSSETLASWRNGPARSDHKAVPIGSSSEGPAPTPSGLPTPSPTPADGIPGSPPTHTGSSNPIAGGAAGADGWTEVKVVFDDADVDNQLEWQRTRVQAKNMDEGSRASKRLGELVQESLDAPLRLHSIRITGATSTRANFLEKVFAPHLASLTRTSQIDEKEDHSASLRRILTASQQIHTQLAGLDIFSRIQPSLECSPSVLANKDDVDLVFHVAEQGRYFVRTATDVGNGEGSATGTARIRNAFGGAELIEANVGFGTKTRSSIQVRGEAPLGGRPNRKAEVSAFVAERDLSHFASCSERVKGGILRYKANSPLGYHELALEATLRQICELTPNASISMREAAGYNTKCSLSHTFTSDTRDDPFMATGDVICGYSKNSRDLVVRPTLQKVKLKLSDPALFGRLQTILQTASFGARAGALMPLFGQPSLFSDRFHLGGPTSVRMFRINSLGPKDNGDYLGGDLHWAMGASLLAPIPTKEHWPLRFHSFVNGGRLLALGKGNSMSSTVSSLFSDPSISAGVGLMYRHAIVRVELNLGVPIAAHPTDGSRKGLQFGLGLNFLS